MTFRSSKIIYYGAGGLSLDHVWLLYYSEEELTFRSGKAPHICK